MRKPSFFILGAARCGTTWMYQQLAAHPQVNMSFPKEPPFFELEFHEGLHYYWTRYFASWRGQPCVGEANHRNIYLPYVPKRIAESVPEAKFIVCVRNPVDRAHSLWWWYYSGGFETLGFGDALKESLSRIEAGQTFEGEQGARMWARRLVAPSLVDYRTYLDGGHYAEQIRRYLKLFDEDRMKILFLEDLGQDPQAVFSDVCSFLGIDTGVQVVDRQPINVALGLMAMRARQNSPSLSRWVRYSPGWTRRIGLRLLNLTGNRQKMSSDIRKDLITYYWNHNRELEKLTGRDLSHWDA